MPTYDFRCQSCGHRFSVFVSISDKDRVTCTQCGSKEIEQLFTGCSVRTGGDGGSCQIDGGFRGG